MKLRNWMIGSLTLLGLGLVLPGQAQRLQALGVSGSFNVARLHTAQDAFQLGSVRIDPRRDRSNDETGNGVTLFGRWLVGTQGWYAQPELGYVSTLLTPVGFESSRASFSYSGGRNQRLDARLLAGYQSGPVRLFAGPGVGYQLPDLTDYDRVFYPEPDVNEALDALQAHPPRLQPTVQVGAGVSLWRLDLNARYEWGLTPYSRSIRFQQGSYAFKRNLQQLILEVGFQIYRRPAQ